MARYYNELAVVIAISAGGQAYLSLVATILQAPLH